MVPVTGKSKQRNPKHSGRHQLKMDYQTTGTGRSAKRKPELAMVKTCGSIYVIMKEVLKAITGSDKSESNEEQEPLLGPELKDNQLRFQTDEDQHNE